MAIQGGRLSASIAVQLLVQVDLVYSASYRSLWAIYTLQSDIRADSERSRSVEKIEMVSTDREFLERLSLFTTITVLVGSLK